MIQICVRGCVWKSAAVVFVSGLLCSLPACGEKGEESATAAGGATATGAQPSSTSVYTLDPEQAEMSEVVSGLEVGALEMVGRLFDGKVSAESQTSLAKAYGAAMERYLFSDADAYIASLAASTDLTDEQLAVSRRQWEQAVSIVSSSPMDPSGMTAHLAMVGGERNDEKPRLGNLMIEGSRPSKGGIGDPRSRGLDVIEITVPLKLKPLKGEPIDGRFGLSFGFDAARGEWVLIGTALGTDVVTDHLVAIPL